MRVAVLAGGRSSEHEVSLHSAANVRAGVAAAGHEVLDVIIERSGAWTHAGEELALRPVLGTPVFVKPARLGSSVGIAKVWAEAELDGALDAAFTHDGLVIVEAFSSGMEVECSVMGLHEPDASTPGEIVVLSGEWYDYEAKYTDGGMELVVPARLPEHVRERVRELARETFVRTGCTGLARVDFFVEGDHVLVNELNTMPGFTETSVYAKLWEASGVPFEELVDRLVQLALERHEDERRYRH
jgi:D-alanine-D-alanine ligase